MTYHIKSQQKAQIAQHVATAREVLGLTQPKFAQMSADQQACEIATFVLERLTEWRASPALRQWVMSGAN